MKKILLGETPLKIASIIFGGNVFGWTLNEEESFKILDAIYEMGINCIDTADVYSRWYNGNEGGESEAIIGKWMKSRGNRKEMIICTKVGMNVGQGKLDISEKHILESIDKSLQRLQTDYVDLYYAHKDDGKTKPTETLSAFKKTIDAGKVRFIGASNFTANRLEASILTSKNENLPQYRVFQPQYNLLEREEYEGMVKTVCDRYNLGVASYFSLASGLLTGKYKTDEDVENSSRTDYVASHWNEKTKKVISKLEEIAKERKATPAAIALSWILHKPGITAPIVSATKESHLQALETAATIDLTMQEMNDLDYVSR